MTQSTKEKTAEIQYRVLTLLNTVENPIPAKDIIEKLKSEMALDQDDLSSYRSDPQRTKFDYKVRFGTISLVKSGWIIKESSGWSITDMGIEILGKISEPTDLYDLAEKYYKDWVAENKEQTEAEIDLKNEDETVNIHPAQSILLEEAKESAWETVYDYLANCDPYNFQNMVGALLEAMDYHVTWIAPPGKDGGIDILAHLDPLGTKLPRIKVQVKRQTSSKIAVDGLRAFMAVLSSDDVGIFVSLGGFTKDAEKEARFQEQRRITLIDAELFVKLWIEHYAQLPESARKLMRLKPVYFLDN